MGMVERTGLRDNNFSGWIRQRLPPSSDGVIVSDIDWIIANYKTKKLMLIEHKCRVGEPGQGQRRIFEMLHATIIAGLPSAYPDWEYLGFHLLQFPGEGFNSPNPDTKDSFCYFDREKMTEAQLIERLTF